MNLIEKGMLISRLLLLFNKSTALKELHAQIITPEGVRMKHKTAKEKVLPDEGLEYIDGDDEDLYVDY